MLAIISLLLLFFLGKTVSILDQHDPIVNTTLGSIRGIIQTSRKGNEFYSFRGIRYARAPIGNLRLKASTFFDVNTSLKNLDRIRIIFTAF